MVIVVVVVCSRPQEEFNYRLKVRKNRRFRKSCTSMTHWGTEMAVRSIIASAAAVVVVASKSNNLSEDAITLSKYGKK